MNGPDLANKSSLLEVLLLRLSDQRRHVALMSLPAVFATELHTVLLTLHTLAHNAALSSPSAY